MRVFEALACGSLLLTNDLSCQRAGRAVSGRRAPGDVSARRRICSTSWRFTSNREAAAGKDRGGRSRRGAGQAHVRPSDGAAACGGGRRRWRGSWSGRRCCHSSRSQDPDGHHAPPRCLSPPVGRVRAARRSRPVLLRPCAARGNGAHSGDRAGGARYRLRRGQTGRGAQGAASRPRSSGSSSTRRPRRRRASASTRSSPATSSGSTCRCRPAVRRDRLRRHHRAPARARPAPAPGPAMARTRGRPRSPASPTCGITPSSGRCSRATGPMSRPACSTATHLRFFTRREIEKLFFRAGFAIDEMTSVIGPGDDAAMRGPKRSGPAGPAVHRRALGPGCRRVLHLSVPGPCPAGRSARPRPDVDRDRHPQPARIHPAVPGQHPATSPTSPTS